MNRDKIAIGLKTGIGLFLIFTAGFFLVGYSIRICMILGGFAGISGGMLAFWWQIEQVPQPAKKATPASPPSLTPDAAKAQSQQGQKPTKSPSRSQRRAVTLLDWLFRSNRY